MRTAGRVSAVGMEFAGAVIGCLLIGWWADGKLGSSPWLAVLGILLGSAVGFKAVYRAAKTMQRTSCVPLRTEDQFLLVGPASFTSAFNLASSASAGTAAGI